MFKLNGEYIPVECVIQMIESGQIDPPKGWNKRYGIWCYGTKNVLADETLLLFGDNWIMQDDVKYVLDYSIGKYVHWDTYVRMFQEMIENDAGDEMLHQLIKEEGFTLESIIGYDPERGTWSRAQADAYLQERGYVWICYVKLLFGKPFIVGKTGTEMSPFDQFGQFKG